MKKKILVITLLVSLLGISQLFFVQKAQADDGYNVAAKAAIAVDSQSGKIFYAKNQDEKLPIASISKLITAYLIYQAVDQGKLAWDDPVEISDYSYQLSQNMELSGVPFVEGKTYTVKELLSAALIASANSAAVSLAEKIGGSESKFIDLAKAQLEEWGIEKPHLVNASGLNNEFLGANIYPNSKKDDENRLSAKDVAIVAYRLINDYPEVLEITKQTTAPWEDVTMQTWNWMLPDMPSYRQGVDGLKTGTTELAGQCFVGTIQQDGQRIITVVLNAENSENDSAARFTATGELMDYVYNNWQKKQVVKKGDVISEKPSIKVVDGKKSQVKLVSDADLSLWVNENWSDLSYQASFTPIHQTNQLTAPITALKTQAGSVVIQIKADKLGYLESAKLEQQKVILVAKSDVKRENAIKLAIKHFINWVNEKL